MSLRIGSLFSGIAGLESGLERAGVGRTVLQCEIEAFPRRVLARHFPGVAIHEDVRTLRLAPGEVDVLCGGFPCQDVSLAGCRKGLSAGTRTGLWLEYARLVREGRPSFVVGENVAALLTLGAGTVFADLSDAGYDLAWDCVPAAAVGAPHRRDRVFVLAWRRDACSPPVDASERAFAAGISKVREGGQKWPARPGQRQFAHEAPRTARNVPDRAKRLKALGNAVVISVAEAVGHTLLAISRDTGTSAPLAPFAFRRGPTFESAQADMFAGQEVARWPRAGTIRGGVVFELVAAAPLAGLDDAGPWPTPTARDGDGRGATSPTSQAAIRKIARGAVNSAGLPSDDLKSAVRAVAMWPTPQAADDRDRGHMDMPSIQRRVAMGKQVMLTMAARNAQETAPLNPGFVEALMGFSSGWTDVASVAAELEAA